MTAASTKPVAAGGPAVARLRVTVGIESLVLLGVLVASALLVTSDPARSTVAPTSVAKTLTVGPDTVRVSAAPAGVHVIALRLQVLDAHQRPVEPAEVDAALSLATQQVGPLPVDLTSGGHGLRTGRATLPLSGTWRLAVTVRTSPIDEATAYVDVPVS
jgi:copper transport protein